MFDNNKNFISIGNNIWVFHNFLSNKELNSILNKISNEKENLWSKESNYKYSISMNEVDIINKKIQELLPNSLKIHGHSTIGRLKPGEDHGVHSDHHEFLKYRELSKNVKDSDCFVLVDNIVFGLVVYLNDDYEGGEIYYTNQNISYKPIAGDLLIHSAEDHCEHGVKTVVNGVRYVFPSSIREKIKNPC